MKKFKAKNIQGYWRVGSYIYQDDNHNTPFRRNPIIEEHLIRYYVHGDWNMGGWQTEEIDKNTICMSTGKTVGHHQELFENDLIRCKDKSGIFMIYWDDKYLKFDFKLVAEYPEWDPTLIFILGSYDKIEIVGNILDKPIKEPMFSVPILSVDYPSKWRIYAGTIENSDIYFCYTNDENLLPYPIMVVVTGDKYELFDGLEIIKKEDSDLTKKEEYFKNFSNNNNLIKQENEKK